MCTLLCDCLNDWGWASSVATSKDPRTTIFLVTPTADVVSRLMSAASDPEFGAYARSQQE